MFALSHRMICLCAALMLAWACVPTYAPQQYPSQQNYPSQQTGNQYPSATAQNSPQAPTYSPGATGSDLEIAVWQGINQQRQSYGLTPLQWDGHLADLARSHSQDMLSRNYFSHTTPEGTGTFQIIERGYAGRWRNMGENIITTSGYPVNNIQAMAQHLVNQWMQSPGHRQNILTPDFTHTGVGIATYGNELRGTQCFVRLQ